MALSVEGYGSIVDGSSRRRLLSEGEESHREDDEQLSEHPHRPAANGLLRPKRAGIMALLMMIILVCKVMTKEANLPLLPASSKNPLISEMSLISSSSSSSSQFWKQQQQEHHDPAKPLYFDQIINHNHHGDDQTTKLTFFQQRYYVNFNHWKGPGGGHPIFLIFGGEGPLERILYPSVSEVLAERFGAITFNVEHRYFGESYPMQHYSKQDIAEQLTPRQALQDIVYFIQEQQTALGCGPRGSPEYCPVMTVGGSYAGLLSTLIRMEYPDVVDIGYAASPCLLLYSHQVTPYVYYEYVTQVAERISPGCPNAVQETLEELQSDLVTITSRTELQTIAEDYGVCSKNLSNSHNSTIPTGSDLAHQLVAYTANQFISTNMDYYPPRPDQKFFQGCAIFQEPNKSAAERMRNYIAMITDDTDGCYEFATPSAQSDDAPDLWDALCCYLVPMIGKSNDTMWPADTYELENDIENCQTNFGITADPQYLEKEFGWNGDLMKNNDGGSSSSSVTRLILTNGYNDGWFPLSFTDPSDLGNNAKHNGVVILNMVNGAHHSDLTHQLQADTPDVALVHAEIAQLLSEWLEEIRRE